MSIRDFKNLQIKKNEIGGLRILQLFWMAKYFIMELKENKKNVCMIP